MSSKTKTKFDREGFAVVKSPEERALEAVRDMAKEHRQKAKDERIRAREAKDLGQVDIAEEREGYVRHYDFIAEVMEAGVARYQDPDAAETEAEAEAEIDDENVIEG
jgi:hypothetical protein